MTLTQEVYEKLREDIYMLRWNDREFLTESALSEAYHVSKAPIREALYRLCQEGMMESLPRVGYRIRVISNEEYEQIQEIRYINESLAIDFFLKNPSEDLLKEVKQAAWHSEDTGGNLKFHLALAKASQNKILIDLIDRLLHCVARSITILNYAKNKKPPLYHKEIAAALEQNNAQLAKKYLKKDIGLEE